MKDCRTILLISVILSVPAICRAGGDVSGTWEKEDVISLVKSHFSQINNIEYTFDYRMASIAEPSYEEKRRATILWDTDKGWEKFTSTLTTTDNPKQSKIIQAWNGSSYTSLIEPQGQSTKSDHSSQGRISSERRKGPSIDPLEMLEMRVSGPKKIYTMVDFLSGKDVLLEGNETVDRRETLVVSVNMTASRPRKEGLVIKYWLDMKRGGIPVRVELRVKEKVTRITSDVQILEVQPGIFFPTGCTVKTFGGVSEGRWSKGETDLFKVDAKTIKLNQPLTSQDFKVRFEPGTYVWNEDVGVGYYQDIGFHNKELTDKLMLDDLAESAKKQFEKDRSAVGAKTRQTAGPLTASGPSL